VRNLNFSLAFVAATESVTGPRSPRLAVIDLRAQGGAGGLALGGAVSLGIAGRIRRSEAADGVSSTE